MFSNKLTLLDHARRKSKHLYSNSLRQVLLSRHSVIDFVSIVLGHAFSPLVNWSCLKNRAGGLKRNNVRVKLQIVLNLLVIVWLGF